MPEITKLNQKAFEAEVLKSSVPVVVDFGAAWCNPCKMLDQVITQLSQEWDGKVKVIKLDVDDNSQLAVQYGVMGVPTLILFVNGQPVQRLSGYQPKDRITSKVGSYIFEQPSHSPHSTSMRNVEYNPLRKFIAIICNNNLLQ